MCRLIATCIIAFVPLGCASTTHTFDRATSIAYGIINSEASRPACSPSSVSAPQRNELAKSLERISAPGLSEKTGLTPLDYAVLADDVHGIKRLVAIGYPLNARDTNGGTLAHLAANFGSKKSLAFLIANGADPNASTTGGFTPLMVAATEHNVDIALSLLSVGAAATSRNKSGLTSLHIAIPCRDPALIKALLDSGAPVDEKAKSLATKFGVNLVPDER